MRGWRRTLRSWPKEAVQMADPASLPAVLRDPQCLAEARREEVFWTRIAIGVGGLLPVAVGFATAAWLAILGRDLLAALTMLSGMALGFVGLFPASRMAEERRQTDRRRRTLDGLEARGEATLGGEFVGVAYGNRLWHHPGLGHDADEGVLTMGFDRLAFVGRASRFEVPKAAILGTEIRVFPAAGVGPLPRLYVAYLHEARAGMLSFALPYRRSARERVEEAVEMKDRLDAWRAERLPALGGSSFVAPLAGDYALAPPDHSCTAGRTAKLLAIPATILLLGLIEVLMTVLFAHMGWARTGYGLVVLATSSNLTWTVLAVKIESKLPARYRFRPPAAEDARDALRDAGPRAEGTGDDVRVR